MFKFLGKARLALLALFLLAEGNYKSLAGGSLGSQLVDKGEFLTCDDKTGRSLTKRNYMNSQGSSTLFAYNGSLYRKSESYNVHDLYTVSSIKSLDSSILIFSGKDEEFANLMKGL